MDNKNEEEFEFSVTSYSEDVGEDYVEAFKKYHEAAENGSADAQYCIGTMYFEGKGVPQNFEEAIKWHKKAAESKHAKSENNLGSIYYHYAEENVVLSYADAEKWYIKAAIKGYTEAQYNLAITYYKAEDYPKNFIKAFMWASISAAQGFELGKELLLFLKSKMIFDDIRAAQKLAKQCWESNYENCSDAIESTE